MFFDWLNSYRAVGYFLEIFIAEFLFVYSLKKRALFYPKLISFLIISVFLMSFVDLYQTASTFIRLMYLLIVIAVSILGICILFDAPFLIATGEIMEGEFPPKAKIMVREFIMKYQDELMEMWETEKYRKLPPLD